VEFICADGSKGYKEEAPFDKILASASIASAKGRLAELRSSRALRSAWADESLLSANSARNLPKAWKEQLKIGGKIVTPIENSIWLFDKKSENEFQEVEHPGFVFVPLVTAAR